MRKYDLNVSKTLSIVFSSLGGNLTMTHSLRDCKSVPGIVT
ncbi:hypothetical protein LEP1GSC051_2755 [Leptospira sp. P2653]|nr:hypothetical protein LEP1GSC051_2755 [Leptospira sp. P2653]